MDCPSCAAKVRAAAVSAGIETAEISTTTQILSLPVAVDDARLPEAERAITAAGYRLDRLSAEADEAQPHHLTPAYRRALWIVIVLNLGYGGIEMVGGYLTGSQALKADALDFFGDGLITLLGLVAIGWSLVWRARSALMQGLFLGAMGLGVMAATGYRLFIGREIDAGVMGLLAFIALGVNLGAAWVLMPHREGDANAKAVWHFSRNDALGNAAVVVAAGLVALSGSRWPDLIAAFAIAGLFLQSAWVIQRDARHELRRIAAAR